MAENINQLWTVACLITNFYGYLFYEKSSARKWALFRSLIFFFFFLMQKLLSQNAALNFRVSLWTEGMYF